MASLSSISESCRLLGGSGQNFMPDQSPHTELLLESCQAKMWAQRQSCHRVCTGTSGVPSVQSQLHGLNLSEAQAQDCPMLWNPNYLSSVFKKWDMKTRMIILEPKTRFFVVLLCFKLSTSYLYW